MLKGLLFAVLIAFAVGAQLQDGLTIKAVSPAYAESTKGVYFGSNAYGVAEKISNIVNMLRNTEVNTVVVDYKDDYGEIFSGEKFKRIVNPFRAEKAFIICRIVTFKMVIRKDHQIPVSTELLLKSRPDGREIWKGDIRKNKKEEVISYSVYLVPALPKVKEFIVSVAEKASDDGCDELNFDYIRFPDGEGISNILLPVSNDSKIKWPYLRQAMRIFLAAVSEGIRKKDTGIVYSADLFGYAAMSGEVGIGQYVEDFAEFGFGVYGMFYPSHYKCKSFNGAVLPDPNAQPYLVLFKSLEAQLRYLKARGYGNARVISWVQGFDLASNYRCGKEVAYADDPARFRQQIRAIGDVLVQPEFRDLKLKENWIVWNSAAYYNPKNFLPKKNR